MHKGVGSNMHVWHGKIGVGKRALHMAGMLLEGSHHRYARCKNAYCNALHDTCSPTCRC